MPHIVITGANRGIGRELVRQYAADGWTVTAAVRARIGADLPAGIRVRTLDLAAPETFAAFARDLAEPVDVLVNNAGVFGPRPQSTADVTAEGWAEVFRVNTIGPLLLTRALLDRVAASDQRKLVTLTSRMGSLTENGDGSAPMYRSSKAAVNMAMQCLSFEVAPRGLGVLLVHPGWVRTAMGTDAAAMDVTESAAGARRVIAAFEPAERLAFRAWDGRDIPW